MTRRELAKYLSKDIVKYGPHCDDGSLVYQTTSGDWGAFPGLQKPPPDTLWYEHVGWDRNCERNTPLKVELVLRDLERKYTGKAARVRRMLPRKK